MAGRSQVPPAQRLNNMSMDELIVSFNALTCPQERYHILC